MSGEQAGAARRTQNNHFQEPPDVRSHRRPSRKVATIVSLVAIPVALAASGLVVAQSSCSAYAATMVNNGATGVVALTDVDANTAAFTASNLKPGSTGSRCIVISCSGYTRSPPAPASTPARWPTSAPAPRTSPPASGSGTPPASPRVQPRRPGPTSSPPAWDRDHERHHSERRYDVRRGAWRGGGRRLPSSEGNALVPPTGFEPALPP